MTAIGQDTLNTRPARNAKPIGETFDAPNAAKPARRLYPKVTARLAE